MRRNRKLTQVAELVMRSLPQHRFVDLHNCSNQRREFLMWSVASQCHLAAKNTDVALLTRSSARELRPQAVKMPLLSTMGARARGYAEIMSAKSKLFGGRSCYPILSCGHCSSLQISSGQRKELVVTVSQITGLVLKPFAYFLEKDDMKLLGLGTTMRWANRYNRLSYGTNQKMRQRLFRKQLEALMKENGPPKHAPIEMNDGWAIDRSMTLPHLQQLLKDSAEIIENRGRSPPKISASRFS